MQSAVAVANRFLWHARRDKSPIDPLKLNKLVILAHGWTLALDDRWLINEQIFAQNYGPMVISVFRAFAPHGMQPIRGYYEKWKRCKDVSGRVIMRSIRPDMRKSSLIDCRDRSIVQSTWEVYGKWTTTQLTNFSHEPGSPWQQVRAAWPGKVPKGTNISADVIATYFRQKQNEWSKP